MIIFDSDALVPAEWAPLRRSAPCYVFNPAIAEVFGTLVMAYRVVLGDGLRRIAICRLDESLDVRPGTVVPLSDALVRGGDWHADPRFCVAGDRLFLHFNSGVPASGANHIYVVELDTRSLRPLGPARPLVLASRQPIEKSWMLFDHGGSLYAVYSTAPHVVVRVDIGSRGAEGPIECQSVHSVSWDAREWERDHGQLRGGTPPVRIEDRYACFFHSSRRAHSWPRAAVGRMLGRPPRRTYAAGFYLFDAAPPFAPVSYTPAPVLVPPFLPARHPQLDPGTHRCVYPTGAVLRDGEWIVSFGVQNEYCCARRFAHEDLRRQLRECRVEGGSHAAAR